MVKLLDDARARALIITNGILGNPRELSEMCRIAEKLSVAGRIRMMRRNDAELRHRLSFIAAGKAPPRRSKPAVKRRKRAA